MSLESNESTRRGRERHFFGTFNIQHAMMMASKASGKNMRQATLLSDQNQLGNTSKISSRKRPAACIEILEDDTDEEENVGNVAGAPKSNEEPQVLVQETLGPMPHDVFLHMWQQVVVLA